MQTAVAEISPQHTSLRDLITKEITSESFQLPVFNNVALKLQESINDENTSIDKIEAIILEDPALASQILKTANSAFYRGLGDIKTVNHAVLRLGSQQVVNIAMLVSQKQSYSSKNPMIKSQMDKLWEHSFASAIGCRWVFQKFGGDPCVAFLSGLLHDIGKLGVLKVIEHIQTKGLSSQEITDKSINDILNGSIHTECGHVLATAWNLPEPFDVVIRDHHEIPQGEHETLLQTVRLMNVVTEQMGMSVRETENSCSFSSPEAKALGLSEIQLAELEIHIEDSLENTDF